MSGTLLIRADASAQIGTGHVMRCLALAQAWQARGGPAALVAASIPAPLAARVRAEGLEVLPIAAAPGSPEDAARTLAAAYDIGARHLVVDGYHLGGAYHEALRAPGRRVLALDDNGETAPFVADLVLNQNLHADAALYARRAPHTRLLLGTRYALLRREFWPWRERRPAVRPAARRLLVTLGGSDPDNVTARVLDVIERLAAPDVEAVVIVGAGNPHRAALEARVALAGARITLQYNVTDMPALMAGADLALSAGGSTSLELALMGVPAALIVIAENQAASVAAFGRHGACLPLDAADLAEPARVAPLLDRLIADHAARAALAAGGRALVDGYGSDRVADALLAA